MHRSRHASIESCIASVRYGTVPFQSRGGGWGGVLSGRVLCGFGGCKAAGARRATAACDQAASGRTRSCSSHGGLCWCDRFESFKFLFGRCGLHRRLPLIGAAKRLSLLMVDARGWEGECRVWAWRGREWECDAREMRQERGGAYLPEASETRARITCRADCQASHEKVGFMWCSGGGGNVSGLSQVRRTSPTAAHRRLSLPMPER